MWNLENRVKCNFCERIKKLFLMYGKIEGKWICNICKTKLGEAKTKIISGKMKKMSYYSDMVLKTLNECIHNKVDIITVRTIRMMNHIESSDKCKIQYIWRDLKFLEKNGFIELYNNKYPKRYRLPKTPIKIEEVSLT